MKFLIIFFLLFIQSNADSKEVSRAHYSKGIIVVNNFDIVPSKCTISGKLDGKLNTQEGELITLNCRINHKIVFCGVKGKQEEKYNIIRNGNIAFIDSEHGNIKISVDFDKEEFTLGSTHFIFNIGNVMTKLCIGSLKLKN